MPPQRAEGAQEGPSPAGDGRPLADAKARGVVPLAPAAPTPGPPGGVGTAPCCGAAPARSVASNADTMGGEVRAMQADTTPCKGSRKDGAPCRSPILCADGYCYLHDPANRPRLREIHAAGGRGKASAASSWSRTGRRVEGTSLATLAALAKVEDGRLEPRQAAALAALASAIVRVYQAGTLEERLQALEAAQAGAAAGRRGA